MDQLEEWVDGLLAIGVILSLGFVIYTVVLAADWLAGHLVP